MLLPGRVLAALGGCIGLGLGEPISDVILHWRTPGGEVQSGDVLDFLPFALAISLGIGLGGACIGFAAGWLAVASTTATPPTVRPRTDVSSVRAPEQVGGDRSGMRRGTVAVRLHGPQEQAP